MSDATTPLWSLRDVCARHPGAATDALRRVSLDILPGRVTALIGPNGAGKSTLVQVLLGLLPVQQGTVHFRGRDVRRWRRLEFAREVGVLPQGEEMILPLAVRDVVAMGRYPHLGPWRHATASDAAAMQHALHATCTDELADRPFASLSGGERQRVRVARALAQDAPTLLLDEPTAALDIAHEMQLFELIRLLAHDGRSLVVVTHALDLAARYADTLLLLAEGALVAAGTPEQVLTESALGAAYRWPIAVANRPRFGGTTVPMVLPLSQDEAAWRRGGS